MTIPQVNALATKHSREQSKRICELKGYAYYPAHELDVQYHQDTTALAWKSPEDNRRLPNGSLTLCEVVGMLEAEGVFWKTALYRHCGRCDRDTHAAGWYSCCHALVRSDNPHDLTAAMDALIKVLETKGEKE